jgi:hypothetical protein
VTARPVLGDFLTAAHGHLTQAGAPASAPAPGRDGEEIGASLYRLITALARYTADLTTSFGNLPHPVLQDLSASGRAAYQVHDALSGAAALARFPAVGRPANELARRLDSATASLAAGRDLLQTHFGSDPHGRRRNLSSWARVISSRPVAWALLDEVTVLARQAADAGTGALAAGPPWPPGLDRRLSLACQWLALAGASGAPGPVPAPDRDLLYAIPGCALPARRLPDGSELIPELRDAVITTSERVGRRAWTAARTAADSAAISVTSWRQIATTATATSHHCHLLLTALADRAAQDESRTHSTAVAALEKAAARAQLSRAAWLRTAQSLASVTTDVRWPPSRAAVEAGDLALWTGRLAYDIPDWVPSSGPRHPARRPESLAPAPEDIPELVAAVHYATDALHQLAVSSRAQVRGAIRARRVLAPAKILPGHQEQAGQFAPADWRRTDELLEYYATAAGAASSAVTGVAAAAREVDASSQVLATARKTRADSQHVRRRTAAPDAAAQAGPEPAGPVEVRLRELGVTSPRLLGRAAGVDALAREVLLDAAGQRAGGELPVAVRIMPDRERNRPRPGTAAAGRRRAAPAPRRARAARQEREAER